MSYQGEIILSIYEGLDGYLIETNKQIIEATTKPKQISSGKCGSILFDDEYSISTNSYYDDLINNSRTVPIQTFSQKYQYSVLYNVEFNTDIMWCQNGSSDDYETYSCGFNFVTGNGTFTVGFMNIHNGSYSHNGVFKSQQLTTNFIL